MSIACTGLDQLRAWLPEARPFPVSVHEAARAAAAGGGGLLIDPAATHATALTGVALLRLASTDPWPSPWADPWVAQAVGAELSELLGAGMPVRLADPGPSADLAVVVTIPPEGVGVNLGIPVLSNQEFAEKVASVLRGSRLVRSVFEGHIAVTVSTAAGR
jgi:hypothetical protein